MTLRRNAADSHTVCSVSEKQYPTACAVLIGTATPVSAVILARRRRTRESSERLVYSSSASVYGDAVTEPMTEDHPYNNNNFYGATKIAGEMMARALRPATSAEISLERR